MNKDEETLKLYSGWLINDFRLNRNDEYAFLLHRLWIKEFYSTVENDTNRHCDGVYLRYLYSETYGIEYEYLNYIVGNCRVIEMMLALSQCAMMSISIEKTNLSYIDLFWIMIKNLGLDKFSDTFVVKCPDPVCDIDDILVKFLDRKYDFNGKGGLFPLRNPIHDQRINEISNQLNEFIAENELF